MTDEEAAHAIVAEIEAVQPRSLADYHRSIFSVSRDSSIAGSVNGSEHNSRSGRNIKKASLLT